MNGAGPGSPQEKPTTLDRIEDEWERLLADLSTNGTIVCRFCNASDVTDDDHRKGCPVWELRARYAALAEIARAARDLGPILQGERLRAALARLDNLYKQRAARGERPPYGLWNRGAAS